MKISVSIIAFLVVSFANGMDDSFWNEKFSELEEHEQATRQKRKFELIEHRETQLKATVTNELYKELKEKLRCPETLDPDLFEEQQSLPQKKRKKKLSEKNITRTQVVQTVTKQFKTMEAQKQFKNKALPRLIENFCATLTKDPQKKIVQLPGFKYWAV